MQVHLCMYSTPYAPSVLGVIESADWLININMPYLLFEGARPQMPVDVASQRLFSTTGLAIGLF